MIRSAFYFKIALKNIISHRLLSAAKLLTSFFCMAVIIFLMGVYSGAMDYVQERCDFREISALKMYVADDIKNLPRNPEEADHFLFWAHNNRVTCGTKYLAGVGIAFADQGFANLFDGFFREGGNISDPENECMIGYEIAQKFKIKLSDKITAGSKKYSVSGIINNAGYRNTIVLCDPQELEIGLPQIYISQNVLYGGGVLYEGNDIQNYFAAMIDFSDLLPIAAACAFMLTFSVITIFNIMIIYARKSSVLMRIHRSVGASKKDIFIVQFFENTALNFVSLAAAFAVLWLVKDMVLVIFSQAIDFSFWGTLLAIVLTFVLSLIYSLGFKKFQQEGLCTL